jgi:hypothetical protein
LRRRGKALPHALRYRELERSHERAYFDYEPQSYDGSIVLFRAARHPDEMNATRTLGWENVVTGTIEVIDLPGSHDDLIEQPALVMGLRHVLEKVQASATAWPSGQQATTKRAASNYGLTLRRARMTGAQWPGGS